MTPLQDFLILGLGRGLQVLAGLITIKTATTLLTPGEVGSMNQLMSLATLGTSALLIPVSAYISRGCLEWMDAGTLSQKLRAYLLIVLAGTLVLGAGAWAIQSWLVLVAGIGAVWVGGLVAFYTAGFSLHTMGTLGLNLIGHRLLYVLFANSAVWGGLLFALWYSTVKASPEMWLLGIFCGFLLSSLSYVLFDRYANANVPAHISGQVNTLPFDRWTVFTFVWPQAIIYTLYWIQSQSYRFVLTSVADIATVGLFAAGYMMCSVPMQTFETLFNEFYSPTLFRALKGHDAEGMTQAWNAYAAAYIPAVMLFGAFLAGNAAFMVKLLLGEQFQAVTSILLWPALTETFRAISSVLYQLGLVKLDMSVNVLPVVVGALIAPVFVYLLAPYEPLLGTALALLAAGVAVLIVVIPLSCRALPVVWPIRRILYAAALGAPLYLMGWIMRVVLGELNDSEAVIALTISGLLMVGLQYVMAKSWLREVRPGVRRV